MNTYVQDMAFRTRVECQIPIPLVRIGHSSSGLGWRKFRIDIVQMVCVLVLARVKFRMPTTTKYGKANKANTAAPSGTNVC